MRKRVIACISAMLIMSILFMGGNNITISKKDPPDPNKVLIVAKDPPDPNVIRPILF